MKKFIKGMIIPLVLTASCTASAVLSPSRPLPVGAFAFTLEDQRLTLLSSGLASIQKRLQLIESAQKSIDTEFFVYQSDDVGRLYTQALVRKARQGVHVRILVDRGFNSENLTPVDAAVLMQNGIEFKYYNHTSLFHFKKANHRSHRKSLIVDGKAAVIGGRNMANDYFEFSSQYNMMDQDVAVEGSIVSAIQKSFEYFWTSPLSKLAEKVVSPRLQDYGIESVEEAKNLSDGSVRLARFNRDRKDFLESLKVAQTLVTPSRKDQELLMRVERYGNKLLEIAPVGNCTETYYYADLPGHEAKHRVVYDQVTNLIATARKTLTVESPFLIQTEPESLFKKALARGVKVDILTNSLYSADVALSIAPFLTYAKTLTSSGANVFVYEGDSPRWLDFGNAMAKVSRWGTHAKTVIVDNESFLVGSFNMDPRSANLNAEMALTCRGNKDLAEALALDKERRKGIAVKLNQNGDPVDGRSKYFNVDQNKKFLYFLTKPFAHLFQSLL